MATSKPGHRGILRRRKMGAVLGKLTQAGSYLVAFLFGAANHAGWVHGDDEGGGSANSSDAGSPRGAEGNPTYSAPGSVVNAGRIPVSTIYTPEPEVEAFEQDGDITANLMHVGATESEVHSLDWSGDRDPDAEGRAASGDGTSGSADRFDIGLPRVVDGTHPAPGSVVSADLINCSLQGSDRTSCSDESNGRNNGDRTNVVTLDSDGNNGHPTANNRTARDNTVKPPACTEAAANAKGRGLLWMKADKFAKETLELIQGLRNSANQVKIPVLKHNKIKIIASYVADRLELSKLEKSKEKCKVECKDQSPSSNPCLSVKDCSYKQKGNLSKEMSQEKRKESKEKSSSSNPSLWVKDESYKQKDLNWSLIMEE